MFFQSSIYAVSKAEENPALPFVYVPSYCVLVTNQYTSPTMTFDSFI